MCMERDFANANVRKKSVIMLPYIYNDDIIEEEKLLYIIIYLFKEIRCCCCCFNDTAYITLRTWFSGTRAHRRHRVTDAMIMLLYTCIRYIQGYISIERYLTLLFNNALFSCVRTLDAKTGFPGRHSADSREKCPARTQHRNNSFLWRTSHSIASRDGNGRRAIHSIGSPSSKITKAFLLVVHLL